MSNTNPNDLFEMFQRMLNPLATPLQSLLFPGLTVEEIDKKIGDMKSVEAWLNANLALLQMSIKTMEYQRSLLAHGEQMKDAPPVENPFANMAQWPWDMMKMAGSAAEENTRPAAKKPRAKKEP
jgi:hypothetical protein